MFYYFETVHPVQFSLDLPTLLCVHVHILPRRTHLSLLIHSIPIFLLISLNIFCQPFVRPWFAFSFIFCAFGSLVFMDTLLQQCFWFLFNSIQFNSIPSAMMEVLFDFFLVLLKSTIISFVLFSFKMRWLLPHHSTERSTSSLYSVSCPSLIHPTTSPCGAPVLLITRSGTQPFRLTNYSLLVSNSDNCGGIHLYLLEFLT